MRRYFNLNIKHPYWDEFSSAADYWLKERRLAPVFFGYDTVEEILSGAMKTQLRTQQKNELLEFLNITRLAEAQQFDPIFVTIGAGRAWIYRPKGFPKSGEIFEFLRNGEVVYDIPKYYEVDFLEKNLSVSSIPYILASMKSNEAFSRGTFREIRSGNEEDKNSYRGNIAAIQSLIGWEPEFSVDRLECVSSIEFETLVSKLFENSGFFVPAHRGGGLNEVDLFAYLENERENRLIKIGDNRVISVQLKIAIRNRGLRLDLGQWLQRSSENYLITLEKQPSTELKDFANQGRYLTRDWVKSAVGKIPAVDQWLHRSLSWLSR